VIRARASKEIPTSKVERLEKQIESLSQEDLSKLRAWFFELDARLWDQQIEADAKAGKLDGLIAEALEDYRAGKAREL
jgi:hypothetical protein